MTYYDNRGVTATRSPNPAPVVLTLPYDVAVTLLGMTRRCSGSPDTSYRGHTDAIGTALMRAMPEANLDDAAARVRDGMRMNEMSR